MIQVTLKHKVLDVIFSFNLTEDTPGEKLAKYNYQIERIEDTNQVRAEDFYITSKTV